MSAGAGAGGGIIRKDVPADGFSYYYRDCWERRCAVREWICGMSLRGRQARRVTVHATNPRPNAWLWAVQITGYLT